VAGRGGASIGSDTESLAQRFGHRPDSGSRLGGGGVEGARNRPPGKGYGTGICTRLGGRDEIGPGSAPQELTSGSES